MKRILALLAFLAVHTPKGVPLRFCILASAFCLLTSVSLASDVTVDTILSPSGAIDSGRSVVPRIVISGGPALDVSAVFVVDDGTPGGYRDSLIGFEMATYTETLSFGAWVPRGRDSMTATVWVRCPGDTNPSNDTFQTRFWVRVWDIAITQIITPPPDTVYDSGVVFYPQCLLWDYSNSPWDTVIVRFRIGPYMSACTLYEGHGDTVTARDPYTAIPGIWACQAFAVVNGDLRPENNLKVDTFTVRGVIRESLWVKVMMPDTIYVGDRMTIRARVCNLGNTEESFWLFLSIGDSAGPVWLAESSQVLLNPGDSTDIDFLTMEFTEPGAYLAVARAYVNGGYAVSDSHYFWVVPRPGVEEGRPQASSHKLQATALRRLPVGVVAFDPTGRLVLNPRSGIYFLRDEGRGTGDEGRIRKVVIQR